MTDKDIRQTIRANMREPIAIQQEPLLAVWQEAMPLLHAHYAEIAAYKDIPLAIDDEFYMRLEIGGALRIFTARRNGKLIGYAVYLVSRNPHYKTSLTAKQDVLYVEPSSRGAFIGLRLVRHADIELTAQGVQVCAQHQKVAHPALGAVLRRAGYEHLENMWFRRLDVAVTRESASTEEA